MDNKERLEDINRRLANMAEAGDNHFFGDTKDWWGRLVETAGNLSDQLVDGEDITGGLKDLEDRIQALEHRVKIDSRLNNIGIRVITLEANHKGRPEWQHQNLNALTARCNKSYDMSRDFEVSDEGVFAELDSLGEAVAGMEFLMDGASHITDEELIARFEKAKAVKEAS